QLLNKSTLIPGVPTFDNASTCHDQPCYSPKIHRRLSGCQSETLSAVRSRSAPANDDLVAFCNCSFDREVYRREGRDQRQTHLFELFWPLDFDALHVSDAMRCHQLVDCRLQSLVPYLLEPTKCGSSIDLTHAASLQL